METGHTKCKKKIIIVSVLVVLALAELVFVLMRSRANIFDVNDERFFYFFENSNEPGEYEVYSLDAYYLEEEKEYFYNVKYSLYIPSLDEWSDIDEVLFGNYGMFHNFYCLNWDDLDGFVEAKARFNRAKKEGIHKTYTMEGIEAGLAAARDKIAKEEAEYEAEKKKK